MTAVIKNIMPQFACKCHFKISHNLITYIILWYICARISPLTTCDSITTKLRLLAEFWGPLKNNFPKTLGTSGQQGKGWGWGGDHRLNRLTFESTEADLMHKWNARWLCMHANTIQYSTVQYSTVQCSAVSVMQVGVTCTSFLLTTQLKSDDQKERTTTWRPNLRPTLWRGVSATWATNVATIQSSYMRSWAVRNATTT